MSGYHGGTKQWWHRRSFRSCPCKGFVGDKGFFVAFVSKAKGDEDDQATEHRVQDLPVRGRAAHALLQRACRHACGSRPDAQPCNAQAGDRGRPLARVRHRACPPRAQRHRPVHPDPRASTRVLPHVPPQPPGACEVLRRGAGHARKDLLQVRGKQHLRISQAQLRHRPGLLRQGTGPDQPHHRNGCRPMGHCACHGVRLLRP